MMLSRQAGLVLALIAFTFAAGCDKAPLTSAADPLYADEQCPSGEVCWEPSEPGFEYGSHVDHDLYSDPTHPQDATSVWHAVARSRVLSTRIASGRVDARTYKYKDCKTSNKAPDSSGTRTVYGIGVAELKFEFKTTYRYGYQVVATHAFQPAPGQSGGGTFSSESSECSNYVWW
jgi:hypothetical protein